MANFSGLVLKGSLVIFVAVLGSFSASQAVAGEPTVAQQTPADPLVGDALAEAAKQETYCNEAIPEKYVERIEINYKFSYEDAKAPMRSQVYYVISCAAGAYNTNSILISYRAYDKVMKAVPLAYPVTDKKDKVVGMAADTVVGGIAYDKATQTFTTFSKGRGIGDIYVRGTYAFFEDQVFLREYEVDSKEGGVDNGKIVFKASAPLQYY